MLRDTTREMEEMQNRMWMERSTDQRADCMFQMFATARRLMINSLPKDLSQQEFKRQVYYRTYGEPLPDDFFKDGE
jgi:hypothetical protein